MVLHMSNLLQNINPLLSLNFYTSYGPFMTALVLYLIFFSFPFALRLGLFLAFSLCFSHFNLIGSHHVTKISFLGFHNDAYASSLSMITHTHVTYLYVFFLRSGINLEGNIKGAPFKFRLQHNFEYAVQYNYARPRDF